MSILRQCYLRTRSGVRSTLSNPLPDWSLSRPRVCLSVNTLVPAHCRTPTLSQVTSHPRCTLTHHGGAS